MTREEARNELLDECCTPYSVSVANGALVSERIARREAEARVRELEEEVNGLRKTIHRNARERNIHLED